MTDTEKTKEQLLDELAQLRQRVQELEQREEKIARCEQIEQSFYAVVQERDALQEKQHFLERLTEISPELLYLFDVTEQRNIYLNARSHELLGYAPEAVLAMGADFMAQRMHPDDLAQVPDYFKQVAIAPEGSFLELEYRMRHANGEWRWFNSRNTVFSRTADGHVHQIIGTAQDITDRKNIEAALQESRSLFDSFMNHAPIAAYIKDEDGRYLYLKSLIEQLYQEQNTSLVGKTDLDFFPIEIAEQLRVNDAAVLASGQAVRISETIEIDNEERYFMSFKFPFRTASGQQVLAGISVDITELQRIEAALHESQLLYQSLAEAIPNHVWTLTPDGKLEYVNQQWREALGITAEQVNQADWSLIVHPDDLPCILQDWKRIQAGETITEREYRCRMADGSYRWFLARMLVMRNKQGQLLRLVGVSTDIDQRKRMEEALRSSEERLALASQAARVGTFEWNIQTHEVFWTAEEEALYGLPPGGFQGKFENWRQAVHPEDRDRAEQDVFNAVANRIDLNNEFRVIHPDGSVRWLAAKGRVFYDAEDQPLRMIGMNEDITDRKQLEMEREQLLQQLETSLGQFEAVINSMSEGLIVSDAEGNVLLFNPAGLVLHEYDSVEQVQQHLASFPDTFEGFDSEGNLVPLEKWPLARVLQGETYCNYEINVHRFDTGTRWIGSFSGAPIYNKQGQMVLAIVTMHDITDRKQAEAALAKSNQTLQAIIQACPLAIMGLRADGTVRIWNPAAERIFGWSQQEVIGRFLPAIPPEKRDEFLHNLAITLQGQGLAGVEARRQKKGNLPFDVELWAAPVDETQAGISCLSIVADITERKRVEAERKQAEESLRQSEERYRYLAESIPQLIWTADAAGVLIDVNQRWSNFTGLPLAQAQAEGWGAVVHPDDVPILIQNWVAAQQNSTYYQAEGRMRRADGTYRWHLHQAVPVKNEQGQAIKWFGTATDIEDQKQLEQQRLYLLEQEQAAREQAEAANRVKDEFLAVLSHELRTPLNPILGWARILRTRQLDPQAIDRALETIERNAKLQAQLIEDLLDVSRILQGKVRLDAGPVNLVTTVESALETVRLSAEAKGIRIQTQLDSAIGQVTGDANRLQQVVWNLLANAVKFTPANGRIEIRLKQVGAYAQVQVSDTGQGINPDFLPFVFEYFRQADSSTTRQFGGLGLGLAIVRHLVELHGGTVKAESLGEGMGATFTVQLPLMASVSTPAPKKLPIQKSQNLSGLRVLVVDDETDIRNLISFILAEQGATVITAASAAEAMKKLENCNPDVLISDIGMPNMDGYALIQQIRTTLLDRETMIPAIALTAYAGDANQRRALDAGFQLHLAKPIEPEQLVETVAQVVAQSTQPS